MSLLLTECTELSILNEVYYGKPKEFIEVEQQLDKICEMCKQITKINNTDIIDINNSKELAKVESILTRYFKVDEVSITFYSTWLLQPVYAMNAFSLPQSLSFFKKDKTNPKRTDPKDLFCNVSVDVQLVSSLDMNGQELLAVILHELGHCFDASFFAVLAKIPIGLIVYGDSNKKITDIKIDVASILPSTLIGLVMGSKPVSEFIATLNKSLNSILASNPMLNSIITNILKTFSNTMQIFSQIFSITGIVNPINYLRAVLPRSLFGYAGEKYADSFATSYGYGVQISAFLDKIDKNKMNVISNGLERIPVLNIGYDLVQVTSKVAFMLCDEHPQNATRIVSQLNKLKRDVSDPLLDPKVKKELMENIKDMEELIDNTVLNKEYSAKHGRLLSFVNNWLLIKIFKGKLDPREWVEVVFNHEL